MEFAAGRQGYVNLWKRARVVGPWNPARGERDPAGIATAARIAAKLTTNRARYDTIAAAIGCPWYAVAVCHQMESGADFATYLGNGQTLNRRTTIVPIGRGPFATWEAGALDALRLHGWDKITNWELPRVLYEIERFNGFGYTTKGINSPYVWSFTDLYKSGKYIRDHVYSASAVSEQCGAAAILKSMHIGDVMTDLAQSIEPFASAAPTVVRTLGGPASGLAVRALAEALSEPTASPEAVQARLDAAPLSGIAEALRRAEDILTAFLPAERPVKAIEPDPIPLPPGSVTGATPTVEVTTTTVPAPAPEPSGLDKLFPALTGWKTIIGIVLYVAGSVAGTLGYITPDVVNAITTVAAGWIGLSLVSKVDRYLGLATGLAKVIVRR